MSLQACMPTEDSAQNNGLGDANTKVTEISNLSDAEGIVLYNYQNFLTFKWTPACTLPNNLSERLKSLWSRAKICRTEYILPPDTAVCMAMALPYARLFSNNETESLEMAGSICYSDEISLCDRADQNELREIITEAWLLGANLKCN